jgi:hypothetical protein
MEKLREDAEAGHLSREEREKSARLWPSCGEEMEQASTRRRRLRLRRPSKAGPWSTQLLENRLGHDNEKVGEKRERERENFGRVSREYEKVGEKRERVREFRTSEHEKRRFRDAHDSGVGNAPAPFS